MLCIIFLHDALFSEHNHNLMVPFYTSTKMRNANSLVEQH